MQRANDNTRKLWELILGKKIIFMIKTKKNLDKNEWNNMPTRGGHTEELG